MNIHLRKFREYFIKLFDKMASRDALFKIGTADIFSLFTLNSEACFALLYHLSFIVYHLARSAQYLSFIIYHHYCPVKVD